MARSRKPHNGRRADRGDAAFRAAIEELVDELMAAKRPWPLKKARHAFERAYTIYVIHRVGEDRHNAAGQLDIGFSTLKEKIRDR